MWVITHMWYIPYMANGNDKFHDRREQFALHLGARGRLVLPAPIRKRLGLKEGDRLVLTLEPDGTLRLTSLREQVKKLRGLLKDLAPGRSLVDELIRDRRAEA